MQVCNISKTYYQPNYNVKKNHINFTSLSSSKMASSNVSHSAEYSLRVLINKFSDLFQSKENKNITKSIANIIPAQTKLYLEQLCEIGRLYSSNKIIDVNIEDKVLEKIAHKGEATIFIMNHSNQQEDPQMLAVLNTLLAEAYKSGGKETFPLPKIILNEDILSTMNPTKRKAFENFGAIGIDATVNGGDKGTNTRAFLPIIKDFISNKCNIFIFPEGRLAIRKDLDLYGRFQGGVANMINKILGIKKNVTVVPVGFSYGKGEQKGLNAMNIGTPIMISRVGDTTTVTSGDILSNEKSCLYSFFNKNKNLDSVTITSNGEPVNPKEVPDFLKTILCENLEICSNKANKKLDIPLKSDDVLLY